MTEPAASLSALRALAQGLCLLAKEKWPWSKGWSGELVLVLVCQGHFGLPYARGLRQWLLAELRGWHNSTGERRVWQGGVSLVGCPRANPRAGRATLTCCGCATGWCNRSVACVGTARRAVRSNILRKGVQGTGSTRRQTDRGTGRGMR